MLEGRKVVELWPPGTPNLTRRAPAWVHHVPPPPPKEGRLAGESTGSSLCTFTGAASTMAVELPPAPEVLVLNGGDVGFWPEGWWHRVTSLPATRAVRVMFILHYYPTYAWVRVPRMYDLDRFPECTLQI